MPDFSLNLKDLTLEWLKGFIAKKYLTPSRRMLKDNLSRNIEAIEDAGFSDLDNLHRTLKNKKKLAELSTKTQIDEKWLTNLKREIGGLISKGVPLDRLEGIAGERIEALRAKGYRNTEDIWQARKTGTDIPDDIFAIADLLRIWGIGPFYARFLYDIGIDSVATLIAQNPDDLLERSNAFLREHGHPQLRLEDVMLCLEHGGMV